MSIMSPAIVESPRELADRLEQLGLTSEVLREAVAAGNVARSTCTADDPATAPGYFAWARATRFLRESLASAGWRECIDGGIEIKP
jgi:hypothetical protein